MRRITPPRPVRCRNNERLAHTARCRRHSRRGAAAINARPTITLAKSAAGQLNNSPATALRRKPGFAPQAPAKRGRPPSAEPRGKLPSVEDYFLSPPITAGLAIWACSTRVVAGGNCTVFASVAEIPPAAEFLLQHQAKGDLSSLTTLRAHAVLSLRLLGHDDEAIARQIDARTRAYVSSRQKRCANSRHEFGVTMGIRLAHILSNDCLTLAKARRDALAKAVAAHPSVERLQNRDPSKVDFPAAEELTLALSGAYGDPSYLLAGFCLGLSGCSDRATALLGLRNTFNVAITPANQSARDLFEC
jgi:hypothetical protein